MGLAGVRTAWAIRLIVAMIVVAGLVVGCFIVWLVFFFDDPTDPGFSRGTAERVLAEELCPANPDSVKPYLHAYADSGFYWVEVRPSGSARPVMMIGVEKTPTGQIRVSSDERTAYFVALSRTSPGC